MTPTELGAHLLPRLGDRAFLALADQLAGQRVHVPGPRTCRAIVFRSVLRRAAQQGWRPARIVSELDGLGLDYQKASIVRALARLGLRPKNPRRVSAGRRSGRRS